MRTGADVGSRLRDHKPKKEHMPRKPNYRFERHERERVKAAKKAAKAEKKEKAPKTDSTEAETDQDAPAPSEESHAGE
jgi:hypothetical protein